MILRFITEPQYLELIDLYHLAWAVGKNTRHDRLLWAVKEFHKIHPAISETAAYKDLSANVNE